MFHRHMRLGRGVVSALVIGLSGMLTACGALTVTIPWPFGSGEEPPTEVVSPKTQHDMLTVYCEQGRGQQIARIDPTYDDATSMQTLMTHLYSGLTKWENDDGVLRIVPDVAEELPEPVDNGDGTYTYTYKIRKDALWSDGGPVTSFDFAYAWRRATGGELTTPKSLFMVIKGYAEGGNIAVDTPDDRTLSVTLTNPCPYWNELLASSAFYPLREDIVSAGADWARPSGQYVSNGAYRISGVQLNDLETTASFIDLVKREDYHDAKSVTLQNLRFMLSISGNKDEKKETLIERLANREYQVILQADAKAVSDIREEYPRFVKVIPTIGTIYLIWNVNANLVPEALGLQGAEYEHAQSDIRRALNLLVDRRKAINARAIKVGVQPASTVIPPGIHDAGGFEFIANAGSSERYQGYYDASDEAYESNKQQAIETLKRYYEYDEATGQFLNFPEIECVSSNNNTTIASAMEDFASLGINLTSSVLDKDSQTERQESGGFGLTNSGWTADHTDPIGFLDIWVTGSKNNYCQFGRGVHGGNAAYSVDLVPIGYEMTITGTWGQTYDQIISMAQTEQDTTKRYRLLHVAEDLLMESGAVCPVFYCSDYYIATDNVTGIVANPLGTMDFSRCVVD